MGKTIHTRKSKKTAEPARTDGDRRQNYLWMAGILTFTCIVFIPAIKNQFVSFDDPSYIYENQYIRGFSWNNLRAIFLTDANNLGNYHPLTLLTYVVNYSFSGLDPTAYHVTNILIHLVNTFLVFRLALLLFTKSGTRHTQLLSAAAALLFGIHPLHVESVAWVSARKDLLYTCFYLLAMLSYIRYLDKARMKHYLLALVFFLLSLLSKGMAVTLPISLIVIDYLIGRDIFSKKVILEKIPFLMLSILFGVLAIIVQQAQGATAIIRFGVADRIVFAAFGFTQYLIKFIYPYKLCGYYPYPDLQAANIPGTYYLALLPAVFSILLLVYFIMIRPNRNVVFGMLFFIVNVLLVLQLFPVGSAVMADRYTYLSSFGIFFLVAWGCGSVLDQFPARRLTITGVMLLYALLLSVMSFQRGSVWRDGYSFWHDVMQKYPAFYPAINNLGEFYENDGNIQEAIQLFSNSIKVKADNPNAYFHRGSMLGKSGRLEEAISDFTLAIHYSPGFTQAYINRSIARAMNKDYHGALADLDMVLSKEKNESAYYNRGIMKNQLNEFAQAIPDFQEAIRMNPSCPDCYYSLGLAHYQVKQFRAAITSLSTCISMNPSAGNAYYYRAMSYIATGSPDSSCTDLQKAVNLGIKAAEKVSGQYCH